MEVRRVPPSILLVLGSMPHRLKLAIRLLTNYLISAPQLQPYIPLDCYLSASEVSKHFYIGDLGYKTDFGMTIGPVGGTSY